jgi:hypothetical protein
MSLDSWKKEHYPITAAEAAKLGDLGAARHSLRKWEGALKKNTKRHEVEFITGLHLYIENAVGAFSGKPLFFDNYSCALCSLFWDDSYCGDCPLAKTLGKSCDAGVDSPYYKAKQGDPLPMIRALRKTVARLEKMEEGK